MLTVVQVRTEEEIEAVRALFREYAAFLGFDLGFQGFQEELRGLPGAYAPPAGRLFLGLWGGSVAGCAALRPERGDACEMKRLYVRPEYRGHGIGKTLAETVIAEARSAGYRRILLDTVPALVEAIALYRSLGFAETAPYRYNPIEGASYWQLNLEEQP